MTLKLRIISIGKTKERWLEEAFSEYQKRLSSTLQIDCLWAKNETQLLDWEKKESIDVCLDPKGCLLTSEEFSQFFAQLWEQKGGRLTVVIGGAEGIPSEIKQKGQLISLSPLTFTHQMTRLIFIEQIYRALEIQKGSRYHK